MNARRGFTLIEVLVALVIFTIFAGAVYGVYRAAYESMTRAESQEDLYQTGRVLLAQINAEITSAYQPASATASAVDGESAADTGNALGSDQLTFLTTAHTAGIDKTKGGLCQVCYLMGDPSQGQAPGLYVQEDLHPGLEVDGEQPTSRLLSPLVVGVNFLYLAEGATDWSDDWPTTSQTTLPIAVRIEMILQSPRPGSKPIVLVSTANLTTATVPPGGTTDGQ
jgi:prepilin-type N-terminal cleavage/methylation domain-containing protein